MKINEMLRRRKCGISFEFFPPKSEAGEKNLLQAIQILKQYKPLYVSMTCGAGGLLHDRTQEAVAMLLKHQELTVMPHLTCINMTKENLRNLLQTYQESGIENIMALRGDPPRGEKFDFGQCELPYAKDLVTFIKTYGHFAIGIAVYPEGHIETTSLEEDMDYTKQKIDAGADFAVTQMFFDNVYFFALLDRMKKANIRIPVLPGILPLTDVAKVRQFASVCRTTIPLHIQEQLESLRHRPKEMEKVGIDFTIQQCHDLMRRGVKQLHFFTLNKIKTMSTIVDAL